MKFTVFWFEFEIDVGLIQSFSATLYSNYLQSGRMLRKTDIIIIRTFLYHYDIISVLTHLLQNVYLIWFNTLSGNLQMLLFCIAKRCCNFQRQIPHNPTFADCVITGLRQSSEPNAVAKNIWIIISRFHSIRPWFVQHLHFSHNGVVDVTFIDVCFPTIFFKAVKTYWMRRIRSIGGLNSGRIWCFLSCTFKKLNQAPDVDLCVFFQC